MEKLTKEMEELTKEVRVKQMRELYVNSIKIRGSFLELTIEVEELIGEIIAYYFCSRAEKRNKFHSLINCSDKVSFGLKISIFIDVFKSHYSDIGEDYPELLNSLKKLQELRNKMAHSRLEVSREFFEKGYEEELHYIYYSKKKWSKKIIRFDEMKEIMEEFRKLFEDLQTIRDQIELRETELPADKNGTT